MTQYNLSLSDQQLAQLAKQYPNLNVNDQLQAYLNANLNPDATIMDPTSIKPMSNRQLTQVTLAFYRQFSRYVDAHVATM